jgi:hexosaminidase
VHFGGDEVTYDCWGQRETIKQYMKEHNISTYFNLSVDFRIRQKALWQQNITGKKKIIYWANEDIDLPLDEDDVIQWWGVSQNVDRLKGTHTNLLRSQERGDPFEL